jgi:hypothetical protein
MSNNASGSQKSAREKMQELQEQLAAVSALAVAEEEAEKQKKRKEAERKRLEDLRRIEQAEKRREVAELKRHKEIAEETVSARICGFESALMFRRLKLCLWRMTNPAHVALRRIGSAPGRMLQRTCR